MDKIPPAQKPRDVICFYPLEFQAEEGLFLMFLAMDVVSEVVFSTGKEDDNCIEQVIKHLGVLMHNKDFKRSNRPFNLVLHAHEKHRDKINALLKPHGGVVAFNEGYIEDKMKPLINYMHRNK